MNTYPGEQTGHAGTCNDIFPITVSILKSGSHLNSRRIILCSQELWRYPLPLRAKVPPLRLDFYLLFISSLASPIFQKQLALGYEECDSFWRPWSNLTGFSTLFLIITFDPVQHPHSLWNPWITLYSALYQIKNILIIHFVEASSLGEKSTLHILLVCAPPAPHDAGEVVRFLFLGLPHWLSWQELLNCIRRGARDRALRPTPIATRLHCLNIL